MTKGSLAPKWIQLSLLLIYGVKYSLLSSNGEKFSIICWYCNFCIQQVQEVAYEFIFHICFTDVYWCNMKIIKPHLSLISHEICIQIFYMMYAWSLLLISWQFLTILSLWKVICDSGVKHLYTKTILHSKNYLVSDTYVGTNFEQKIHKQIDYISNNKGKFSESISKFWKFKMSNFIGSYK